MINLLIFLSKKFSFIKNFLDKLTEKHQALKIEQKPIDHKKLAEELAQLDLKRVVAYEKNGEASGYKKPNVIRVRR